MMTSEMLIIAGENLETHIEIEQEDEELKKKISPLRVWITGASCPTCYNLIPLLVNGEVFGMEEEISIHLLNNSFEEGSLSATVMEGQDLAAPLLREISVCTVLEEAFFEAEVVIILNDDIDNESESLENRIRARLPLCQLFGSLIEKNARRTVKVIVAAKTFLNLTTSLLITYTPSINPRNIIAVAMVMENEAKATLARKLKTTAADIKDVIIWGNITGSHYVDLRKAKVFRYNSAIWGPPSYSRYLLSLIFDRIKGNQKKDHKNVWIFDPIHFTPFGLAEVLSGIYFLKKFIHSEWISKEFVNSFNVLSSTRRFQRGISTAHSVATILKFWYHDSPPGEIFSLGLMSEGEFGTPEGLVYSMPVRCMNGVWFPCTDLPDTELTEDVKKAIIHDLEQEKLIAFGEVLIYQPYIPAELLPRENRVRIQIDENKDEDQKEQTEFLNTSSVEVSEAQSSQEPLEGTENESLDN
nr:putative malate dehydrogenase 1B isoform X4 [Phascolarctos cinereus]XP_020864348.1 putative malate dehydrogenase 1B isoform X4 [Phascolarctos cinereus]XP_020864349.1 putative malate dehydrogenase 1B isoform X4 [Phascolarctos cinereus]